MEEYIRQNTECGVCFKVLTDPRMLQCLHTFCFSCLTKIQKDSTVTCPYCKAITPFDALKFDFKAQELVDLRQKQEGTNLDETFKKQTKKQLLQHHRVELVSIIDDIKGTISEVKSEIDDIATIREATLAVSNTKRNDYVAYVHQEFDKIDGRINEECSAKKLQLEGSEGELQDGLNKVQKHLDETNKELENVNDECAPLDYRKGLYKQMADIPDLPKQRTDKLNLKVVGHMEWQATPFVSLDSNQQKERDIPNTTEDADNKIASADVCRKTVSNIPLKDLTTKEFTLLQQQNLLERPNSLFILDDKIVVCSEKGFEIYAPEEKFLRRLESFTVDDFGEIYEMVELRDRRIAVTAKKGLFVFDKKNFNQNFFGQKDISLGVEIVSSKRHTGVKEHHKQLISVSQIKTSPDAIIFIYQRTSENKWIKKNFIYLPHGFSKGHTYSLEVTNDSIYVGCTGDKPILKLNWEGELLSQHGKSKHIRLPWDSHGQYSEGVINRFETESEIIKGARIQSLDANHLLISDFSMFRLQVLDDQNKWYTLKTAAMACIGAKLYNGRMYVICRDSSSASNFITTTNCLQIYKIR